MSVILTAKSNDNIKHVKKLMSSSHYRRKCGEFVSEGLRLCTDAADNGYLSKSVFYTKSAFSKSPEKLEKLISSAKMHYEVSEDIFAYISDTVNPQGVLCVMDMPKDNLAKLEKNGKYIVLHGLSNPDNVGAVSRSAEAFGLSGMITLGGCDIYNPKALRASMGALLRLPVFQMSEDEFFNKCRDCGIAVYACVVDGGEALGSFRFDKGCATVIGNEANGLPESFVKRCDRRVTIHMSGQAESLNAAAAAAVMLYEMTRK